MRLVQIAAPPDLGDAVREVLDRAGIEYLEVDASASGRFRHEISFALPTHAVEPVLDDLRTAGLTDEAQVVVIDAETVISGRFEDLQEAFAAEEVPEDQIARQELETQAAELTPTPSVYVTMTVISAVVATAGLLLNSPAVVVGSMVIAPLIGPALSASVGTVVNDDDLFRAGVRDQILGILVAIGGAAAFAALLRFTLLVPTGSEVLLIPEVAERLRPDMLSLFIALGAGVAGMLSLTTGISAALVGVMIAAALIPPAAAAGVALAWGEPVAAVGAGVLVLVNIVSINIAGLLTLWRLGYRPARFFETSEARRQLLFQLGMYGIAVGTLSSFLVASSLTAIRHAEFEADARAGIRAVLADEAFAGLTLLDLQVTFAEGPVLTPPERIVVEIGTPEGQPQPQLEEAIQREVARRTGHEVFVRVRFVTVADTNRPEPTPDTPDDPRS